VPPLVAATAFQESPRVPPSGRARGGNTILGKADGISVKGGFHAVCGRRSYRPRYGSTHCPCVAGRGLVPFEEPSAIAPLPGRPVQWLRWHAADAAGRKDPRPTSVGHPPPLRDGVIADLEPRPRPMLQAFLAGPRPAPRALLASAVVCVPAAATWVWSAEPLVAPVEASTPVCHRALRRRNPVAAAGPGAGFDLARRNPCLHRGRRVGPEAGRSGRRPCGALSPGPGGGAAPVATPHGPGDPCTPSRPSWLPYRPRNAASSLKMKPWGSPTSLPDGWSGRVSTLRAGRPG